MAAGRSDADYLYDYVRNDKECVANPHCKGAITRYIKSDGKIIDEDERLIVYRGHYKRRKTIDTGVDWFSTSTDEKVSVGFMNADRKCCLFKIHCMPGIRYIDVNKALGVCTYSERGIYNHEKEIILLGGGVFYKDARKREEGFKDLENGRYETWYFPNRASRSRSSSPSRGIDTSKTICLTPVSRATLVDRAQKAGDDLDYISPISELKKYLKEGERFALPQEERDLGGGGTPAAAALKRTRGRYTGTRRRRRPALRHTRAAH